MKTNADQYILALDLGTTGSRAILFDPQGLIAGLAYKELTQYYPQKSWLEHNADEIWQSTQALLQQVLQDTGIRASSVAAIGLSVQRETCLLWDKTTGKPLHNAIVWQDRRTTPLCNRLKELGHEKEIQSRTGLVVDAYFSATKLAWLIEEVQRSCSNVNFNNVIAGTVDTWVLWNLTGGQVHANDHTNASRTMLMNLADRDWDTTLLDLFGIPARMMPQIQPSLGIFGQTDPSY